MIAAARSTVPAKETELPAGAQFVVYGRGRVQHIMDSKGGGGRSATWCQMFYHDSRLHTPREDESGLPVCGACLRTLKGRRLS